MHKGIFGFKEDRFTSRKTRGERFARRIDELLDSGECSVDSTLVLENAKKMLKTTDFSFVQLYIEKYFDEIALNPRKKLSDNEQELLKEVRYSKDAVWASRQNTPLRNGADVSIDEIKKYIAEQERNSAKEDNPYGTGGTSDN